MRIKTLFTIFAAIAALSASAQTGSEPQAGDIVRQGNSIYYLVRVFATPEQNAAFQRDIDIMRRHATAIDKCKLRIKEITDAEKTFETRRNSKPSPPTKPAYPPPSTSS